MIGSRVHLCEIHSHVEGEAQNSCHYHCPRCDSGRTNSIACMSEIMVCQKCNYSWDNDSGNPVVEHTIELLGGKASITTWE